MTRTLSFVALRARQSPAHTVFAFTATAEQVFAIAKIDRAGRSAQGDLFGFQRPQIASHIHEIRDYLQRDDAVLPNSIVVAFSDGVSITPIDEHLIKVQVDVTGGPPGLIVDGQQRLTALQPLTDRHFEVFVTGLVCEAQDELRKQFILINNTRPLPKELIYELLPTVNELPERLSSRSFASALAQRLNFDERSSLRRQIHLHTNPNGTISSNALQRVIMNSRSNGAFRDLLQTPAGEDGCFNLISDFYGAVQEEFRTAWVGMSPKTSRLIHSVGIVALGYVMEVAFSLHGAAQREAFRAALRPLKRHTAWTSGQWHFRDEVRPWNRLQNVNSDIRILSEHLIRLVKGRRTRPSTSSPAPHSPIRPRIAANGEARGASHD